MAIDLLLGHYESTLRDASCDTALCDPPYSKTTHEGALSSTGEAGVDDYAHWSDQQAVDLVDFLTPRTRVWMVVLTDDVLGPVFRARMEAVGRYAFPLLPILQHQPRQMQDGPPQHGCYAAISRPRDARFTVFGADPWPGLPGWYGAGRVRAAKPGEPFSDNVGVRGGKPLSLVREVLQDYTRPGFRVLDTCAGAGSTLVGADGLGLDAVGSEIDPQTHTKALAWCGRPRARNLFDVRPTRRPSSPDLFPTTEQP